MSANDQRSIPYLAGAAAAAVLLLAPALGAAELSLAAGGATRYRIALDSDSTAAETHAARELQHFLRRITNADFKIVAGHADLPRHTIIVGAGDLSARYFPDVPAGSLDADEIVIATSGERLLLAGGGSRGTLYAVYRLLQRIGCRWWAPGAEFIPEHATLKLPPFHVREKPGFKWRDVHLASAFDRDWGARNFVNGTTTPATEETGGGLRYAGFVHTFYKLVPPGKYFDVHPEWYSQISGRRRIAGLYASQLCLSNQDLRRFVAERVKETLRDQPGAQIISVSQNDWGGFCQCHRCRALYDKYGATSGALVEFVNTVAASIEREFPHVLVDTLAYSQTRSPPRGIRAHRNVAIRFCCIECDAAVPLDHPRNRAYLTDFDGWRRIASRLHVWDYTANYNEYFLPHPNWFVLGENLRLFRSRDVESVFLQGVPAPPAGEMPEMRAWLLAQLAWNPDLVGRQVAAEFLAGYYGRAAAVPIAAYLELMSATAAPQQLSCHNSSDTSSFLSFSVMRRAEELWMDARRLAANDAESLRRVRRSHASVRYAWLVRWLSLQREALTLNASWPLPHSRARVADEWYRTLTDDGLASDLQSARLEESPGHLTAHRFAKMLSVDPLSPAAAAAVRDRRRATRAVVPMPRAMLFLSAGMMAAGLLIRRRHHPLPAGRVFLVLAILANAGAVLILQSRGSFFMARYAVLLLAAIAGALLCSVLYFVLSTRGLSVPLRAALVIAALSATGYAMWWATSYSAARLRTGRKLSLPGARLARANLRGVIMQHADLRNADLRAAYMANAVVNYSNFDGADLRRADLTGARMIYASFREADLRGADLRGAAIRDLTHTTFRGAVYDEMTRLPAGFHPPDWDMINAGGPIR